MLRSDEAHSPVQRMPITAIAQSARVCKLVCVKERESKRARDIDIDRENVTSLASSMNNLLIIALKVFLVVLLVHCHRNRLRAGLHHPPPPRAKLHAAAVPFYNHTERQNRYS